LEFKAAVSNALLFGYVTSVDGFLPYGPEYDEVVYFFDRDEGYSRTVYFKQKFLLGSRHYRRFWVRC